MFVKNQFSFLTTCLWDLLISISFLVKPASNCVLKVLLHQAVHTEKIHVLWECFCEGSVRDHDDTNSCIMKTWSIRISHFRIIVAVNMQNLPVTYPQCFMFCGLSMRMASLILRSLSGQPLETVILWSSDCLGLLGVGWSTTWEQ